MNVLITAGATRNPVDAVRYLSAASSGRTGVRVARALQSAGCEVHLLGSAEAVLRAVGLSTEVYSSTRDLMARMEGWVLDNPAGAVVHSAAVGDYECLTDGAVKIPSGRDELILRLTPTPKIADHVRAWGLTGLFATFKAAPPSTGDREIVEIAERQRSRTGSDLVFANVLGRLGTGVWLIGDTAVRYERRDDAVAALVDAVVAGRTPASK